MSRINILGSEKYGDNGLTVGWDTGTAKYFVVAENESDEPVYWKPLLDSVEDVRRCFTELGEPLPEAVVKQLIKDRLVSSEEIYGFDLSDGKFFGNNSAASTPVLRLAWRALSFLYGIFRALALGRRIS